jgi:hypothetical protein
LLIIIQDYNKKYENLFCETNPGSIPSTLFNLPKIISINLFSNSLVGTIPTQLGLAGSLGRLDFHNNHLTGFQFSNSMTSVCSIDI